MGLISGMIGGAIASTIFGSEGISRYIILKFKSEKEFKEVADAYEEIHHSMVCQNTRKFPYKGSYYVPVSIMSSGGQPELADIFFVLENQDKICQIDLDNKKTIGGS